MLPRYNQTIAEVVQNAMDPVTACNNVYCYTSVTVKFDWLRSNHVTRSKNACYMARRAE